MSTVPTTTIVDQLAEMFRAAEAVAVAAGTDPEDGGTCNLDSPAFRIDGLRKTTIEKAAELAGVGVDQFSWFGGRKWFFLRVTLHGQANRRARMSSAADHALREYLGKIPGLHVCEYQQCD